MSWGWRLLSNWFVPSALRASKLVVHGVATLPPPQSFVP